MPLNKLFLSHCTISKGHLGIYFQSTLKEWSDCWANTPVEDIWRMLFEFYWLRSCCLSPFTSQWAQTWPLCCLGTPYVIGPNTIKCTFSILGSKLWQPLRCPRAQRGTTPVTYGTWTMTLIYKQVTSATTAFTQGQLRSLYTKKL